MIHLGKHNTLTILRDTDPGLYLGDEEENVVLLPHKYKPEQFEIGDEISVFVYLDYDERMVATTLEPLVELNNFGYLRCFDVSKPGAFLEWGLEKHLFVPFKEQARPMKAGSWYIVHLSIDPKTNRLVGSSKTNKFLDNSGHTLKQFDKISVLVSHITEKGANVIIEGKYKGLIYIENIFEDIRTGDRIEAYIKKIRPDGKIDVVIQEEGYRSIAPNAQFVLDELKASGGFIALHDKSPPDDIKRQLGLSKKSFKKALGSLYKSKLIVIDDKGISLVADA